MREGIDSLAYLLNSQLELDPFSGQVFLFCGGRKDHFKALYWDAQGFWLWYKRFGNGKRTWISSENEVNRLTSEQLDWLMKGAITPKINSGIWFTSLEIFQCGWLWYGCLIFLIFFIQQYFIKSEHVFHLLISTDWQLVMIIYVQNLFSMHQRNWSRNFS